MMDDQWCTWCKSPIYGLHDCDELKEAIRRQNEALNIPIVGNHPPTPAKGLKMPQTREYWEKRADMDQELILEQRDEISRLKQKINKLEISTEEAKKFWKSAIQRLGRAE